MAHDSTVWLDECHLDLAGATTSRLHKRGTPDQTLTTQGLRAHSTGIGPGKSKT